MSAYGNTRYLHAILYKPDIWMFIYTWLSLNYSPKVIANVSLTSCHFSTSCMTSTFKENFGRTCEGFSTLNIRMKVSDSEAYQSTIPINASIVSFDMQGGSCLNIILYTGVTKWLDSHVITPLKLHSNNNLKYVFTVVSINDHAHSKPRNPCQAQIAYRM